MLSENYTADNICRSIGIDSFANDRHFADADEWLRVLLAPSFHPEACVTFARRGETASVSVVAARSQIWAQNQPSPRPTPFDRLERPVDGETLAELNALLLAVGDSVPHNYIIIDGMRAHTTSRVASGESTSIVASVMSGSAYGAFVAAAVRAAWNAIDTPRVRNALRDVAKYVGVVDLPAEPVPPEKPTFRTMVIGTEDDRHSLLAALGKLRDD